MGATQGARIHRNIDERPGVVLTPTGQTLRVTEAVFMAPGEHHQDKKGGACPYQRISGANSVGKGNL